MEPLRAALRDDIEAQFELPHLPPPLTANRAKDFPRECKRCQRPCGYCNAANERMQHDPLGR